MLASLKWSKNLLQTLRSPEDTRSAVRAMAPIMDWAARIDILMTVPNDGPDFKFQTRYDWGMPIMPFWKEDLPKEPAAERWFLVHDILHALTQYGTTREGETLLGFFMLGANPLDPGAMMVASTWPVSRPSYSAISTAFKWGEEVGPRVFEFPYEKYQDHTIEEIRYMLL